MIDAPKKRLDELGTARWIEEAADLVHKTQSQGQPLGRLTPEAIVIRDGKVAIDLPGSPTTAYCAPERLRGGAGDRRSDVFTLGVILWEALAHVRLFEGPNDDAVKAAVLDGEIQPVTEMNANVPSELDAICQKALARDPANRYPSAKVMAAEISTVLDDAGYPEGLAGIAKWIGDVSAVSGPVSAPVSAPVSIAATPSAPATRAQLNQTVMGIAPIVVPPSKPVKSIEPSAIAPATPVTVSDRTMPLTATDLEVIPLDKPTVIPLDIKKSGAGGPQDTLRDLKAPGDQPGSLTAGWEIPAPEDGDTKVDVMPAQPKSAIQEPAPGRAKSRRSREVAVEPAARGRSCEVAVEPAARGRSREDAVEPAVDVAAVVGTTARGDVAAADGPAVGWHATTPGGHHAAHVGWHATAADGDRRARESARPRRRAARESARKCNAALVERNRAAGERDPCPCPDAILGRDAAPAERDDPSGHAAGQRRHATTAERDNPSGHTARQRRHATTAERDAPTPDAAGECAAVCGDANRRQLVRRAGNARARRVLAVDDDDRHERTDPDAVVLSSRASSCPMHRPVRRSTPTSRRCLTVRRPRSLARRSRMPSPRPRPRRSSRAVGRRPREQRDHRGAECRGVGGESGAREAGQDLRGRDRGHARTRVPAGPAARDATRRHQGRPVGHAEARASRKVTSSSPRRFHLRSPALRSPALRSPALRSPALRSPALRSPALRSPALPITGAPITGATVPVSPAKAAHAVDAPVKLPPPADDDFAEKSDESINRLPSKPLPAASPTGSSAAVTSSQSRVRGDKTGKGDVLAGWGWGTDTHDALPAGEDDDFESDRKKSKKRLLFIFGGAAAAAVLVTVVALAAGGGGDDKKDVAKKPTQTEPAVQPPAPEPPKPEPTKPEPTKVEPEPEKKPGACREGRAGAGEEARARAGEKARARAGEARCRREGRAEESRAQEA